MFLRLVLVGLLASLVWALLPHTSSGAGHDRIYVVRPADTLWSIAASRYGGDPREGVWKIERRNGLHEAMIAPGDSLVLPP
jgi:nucleoid-associated protein YgaU